MLSTTLSRALVSSRCSLAYLPALPACCASRQVASMSASKPDPQQFCDAMEQLYTSKDTAAQDAAVDKFYSKDAEFHDNITQVFGADNIKTQFHSLPQLFKWAKWNSENSTVTEEDGKQVVSIKNQQDYMWGEKEINLPTYTRLFLDDQGKIVRHLDAWEGSSDGPVLGMMRRAMGVTSTAAMKAAGM